MLIQNLVMLCAAAAFASAAPPDTLRFTQILFRHGDRSPTEDFPNNPYGEEAWPNGRSQLTQLGMRQARDLGVYMRTRYDGYLNSTYVANQIYVRSSDKDRTLMSAYAVLAGLYPPQGFQQWDKDINWQPIPVHTVDIDNDIELTVDVDCKLYNDYYEEALLSEEAQKIYKDNEEMILYVTEKAGWDAPLLPNIWDTFDPLFCMKQHPELGFTFPSWLTDDIYEWLAVQNKGYWVFHFLTQRMRTLRAGPFFRMLTQRIQEVVNGSMTPKDRKMMLYSSHDSMQAAVLIALGVWDQKKPPYTAAIFFELHEPQPGEFRVQIFYKNDTTIDPSSDPVLLTIPGCGSNCLLDEFLAILEPNIYQGTPEDWREECDMTATVSATGMSGATIATAVIAIAFIIPVLVALVCLIMKRASHRSLYNSV